MKLRGGWIREAKRNSLPELAEKMAVGGPFKHELANRRVRGLVCGQWLFDTTDAEFVWEHPYCMFPACFRPALSKKMLSS
jgi:hypothetical protein